MSRQPHELLDYANADLIDELNDFMIAVKKHLYDLPARTSKPTIEYMDHLQQVINNELKKDAKPMRRY